MGMHDHIALVTTPDGLDDIIDDGALKLRGGEKWVSRIGAQIVGKDSRTDKVDFLCVHLIADFPPLLFVDF